MPPKPTKPSSQGFRGTSRTSSGKRDVEMQVARQNVGGVQGSSEKALLNDKGNARPVSGASKSDRSIKEKEQRDKQQDGKMAEEAKQTVLRIVSWLSKLEEQIERNEFDIKDFQTTKHSKGKVDDKGARKIIQDICNKLKNRKEKMNTDTDTEKKKLETAIEQLEYEIKSMERNKQTANKSTDGQKDSLSRIKDCTESVKAEKVTALSEAKTIYESLWKLSEGKQAQLKRKPMNMSTETDIVGVLKEISVHQSELFRVLLESKEKYKKEVDRLHDDLKRFDGVVTEDAIKTNEEGDNVIQAIRLVRKELNKRVKEIKEDLQKGASNDKVFWSKLHTSVTKLWKTALNDEEVTCDVRDNTDEGKVLQMVRTVTKQFEKLEKVAFKLEGTCYGIYEKVHGTKPAKKDQADDKTSINILETTLRKLDETKTEIVGFTDKFEQLVNILQLKQKENSISRRCQLVVESIEGYQKKYNELRKKLEDYEKRERIINTEKEDLLRRLSKVASANLTNENPNIADLSDQNRPTKLAEQFSELYDNLWTDAFEVLKPLDDRKRIAFLWEIIVETYKCCKEISINHQKILMQALQTPTDCMGKVEKTKTKKSANELILSPVQSRSLSELKKQTVDLSVEDVRRYVLTKHKEWSKTKGVGTYVLECIKLCWLMNVQSPPVYMVTYEKEGSKFDTDHYRYYTKTGKKTDFLVWPVLLLHERGPLLCKGVAQGK